MRWREGAVVAMLALAGCWRAPEADAPERAARTAAEAPPAADAGVRDGGGAASLRCATCHAEIAREWATSMHHRSFDDDVFQAEYAFAAEPFCVRCHAPLADPVLPQGAGAAAGVDCATCHVEGDAVLSTFESGHAPHAVRVDPSFGTERACAQCHDFHFGRRSGFAHDGLLQRTLHEWEPVRERGVCQRCHMPDAGGHRSHAFPAAHDDAQLRRALRVEASARRDGTTTRVELVLRAGDVAHAVPTGDMFRRLSVTAWPEGRAGAAQEAVLTRRFGVERGRRREVGDDRVQAAGERRVELVVPAAAAVHWRVEWQALAPDDARARGLAIDDVVRTMAEGRVRVER